MDRVFAGQQVMDRFSVFAGPQVMDCAHNRLWIAEVRPSSLICAIFARHWLKKTICSPSEGGCVGCRVLDLAGRLEGRALDVQVQARLLLRASPFRVRVRVEG